MSREPAGSGFYMPELTVGTVAQNITALPQAGEQNNDNRLLVDFLPSDNHQYAKQIPVVLPFGLVRRPRISQMIAVEYATGHPQYGYVLGHAFNNDASSAYIDDLPAYQTLEGESAVPNWCTYLVPQIDDLAFYHDETGAMFRFRNVNTQPGDGTPTNPGVAGADGSPGRAEILMRSGATIALQEYPVTGAQNPPVPSPGDPPAPPLPQPTRATLTVSLPPSTAAGGTPGASLVIDQPVDGSAQSSLNLTLQTANGAVVITIDNVTANVTINTQGIISLEAPKVLSGETPLIPGQAGPNQETASGTFSEVDVLNEAITHQASPTTSAVVDGAKQLITHTAAPGVQTVIDGPNDAITHLASQIGMGDSWENLFEGNKSGTSIYSALRWSDLNDFENSLFAKRMQDLKFNSEAISAAFATASPPVTIAPLAVFQALAALLHVSLPTGSSIMSIKT